MGSLQFCKNTKGGTTQGAQEVLGGYFIARNAFGGLTGLGLLLI